MKLMSWTVVLGLILGATITSCSNKPDAELDSRVVEAQNTFGFKLFSEISGEPINLMISPTSIAFALTMTYNGAAGETRSEMARTLEISGMETEEVNLGNLALSQSLQETGDQAELLLANSLWMRQGFPFDEVFLERNRTYFGARAEELDFSSAEAPSVINGWVSEKTGGKITDMISRLSDQAVLVLLNAIYFKGIWQKEFDPERTGDQPFNLADGTQKIVSMMSMDGEFSYYEEENFQAVKLPYGEGRLNMYIFLPNQESSLVEFLETLDCEGWKAWMGSFEVEEGNLFLPRFEFDYERELNDDLKALGMDLAFNMEQADFSGMSELEPLFIALVKHKSAIEVNEEGTEAAAATAVVMELAAAPEEEFWMVCDRPFFFAIADEESDAVLFMGTVAEPM
jgi:serpin B